MKTANEIRNTYIDFFKERGHKVVPSSPVVPFDDPTLLFTNAGMNQFKDVFLGTGTRDYKRAVDSQKCIRAGGKHNDLEEVGRDGYHHTFFEMLGNWSFGDYYKKEAIKWAWELLTEVYKLPKDKLWATVYKDDDEAMELWKSETDINPDHILKFDEKDNFWEMGDTGPCGPCSEIHIDMSENGCKPEDINAGIEDVIEIWNLVFIQYNRDEKGNLNPLPKKHVDTGMGFERLVRVMQGVKSNYETDLFKPIIDKICELTGRKYEGENVYPISAIADHIRCLTFAITDGAIPSNEGRGYVLRRILRRASRLARKLGYEKPMLFDIVDTVVDNFSGAYPELLERKDFVKNVVKSEEESFNVTLDRGIELFNEVVLSLDKISSQENVVNILNDFKILLQDIRSERVGDKKFLKAAAYDPIENFHKNYLNELTNTSILLKESISRDKLSKYSSTALNLLFKQIENIMFVFKSDYENNRKLDYDLQNANIEAFIEQIRLYLNGKIIPGYIIFKLYDTFGFPIDLIEVMASERNFKLDMVGYHMEMLKQKNRSRKTSKNVNVDTDKVNEYFDLPRIKYDPYNLLEGGIKTETFESLIDDFKNICVLKKNPFYEASGGQISDTGKLIFPNGDEIKVLDSKRFYVITEEDIPEIHYELPIIAKIDYDRRLDIQRNHSATHLMHEALKRVLGDHVKQMGSLVHNEYLRFDFPHFKKMEDIEIKEIEDMVNDYARQNVEVVTEEMSIEEGNKIPNVKKFFGEKYGDIVRVVTIDPSFSIEFCGGTHVVSTNDIGLFKIVKEESISSGTRRIFARTGKGIIKLIDEKLSDIENLLENLPDKYRTGFRSGLQEFENDFKAVDYKDVKLLQSMLAYQDKTTSGLEEMREKYLEEKKQAEKELLKKNLSIALDKLDELVAGAEDYNGVKILAAKMDLSSMDELKEVGEAMRSKLQNGVGLIAIVNDGKINLACSVSDPLIGKGLNAGQLISGIAKELGGGGGGRPNLATAGAKDVDKLDSVLAGFPNLIKEKLA